MALTAWQQAGFGAVRELLGRVLGRENAIDVHERAVAAQGMATIVLSQSGAGEEHEAEARVDGVVRLVGQREPLKNPDTQILFDDLSSNLLLADIADYGKGSTTGDGPRFLLHFWEFRA